MTYPLPGARLTGPVLDAGDAGGRAWFRNLPVQYSPDYYGVFDDFGMVANDQTNDWTVVKDSGASVAIQADTRGGKLVMTSAATTNDDGSSIQGNEIFLPAADKAIWFETKIALSDADDMDMFVGLSQNFASNPEAVLTASNRIGFQVNDGGASILCKTEAGDTETSTDSGIDAVDATEIILGFVVRGTGKVEFYINRALVATHTTNIPATELAVAAFELSGSNSGTKSMTVDYILCVANR